MISTKIILSLLSLNLFASPLINNKENIGDISEGFGYSIGKHLEHLDIPFDMNRLLKGILDAQMGKAPIMTEKDCMDAISNFQQIQFKKICEMNLKRTESFLKNNAVKNDVVCLANGKIQYRILSEGKFPATGLESSILIRYTLKTIDGVIIEPANVEEIISMKETILGLNLGLVSMKKKEKREIFIHPDLAFGYNKGNFFPPNSLLICEVELLEIYTDIN